MRTARIMAARTLGRIFNRISSALATGAFLSVTGFLFALNLASAEGSLQPLSTLWAVSVAPALPFLAAYFGMDVWSGERGDGRLSALLTVAARETDLVAGKFFGVWAAVSLASGLSGAALFAALHFFAPLSFAAAQPAAFLPAFFALALQGGLWSAAAVAASAFFRPAALAACVCVAATALAPRAVWAALLEWAPRGRAAFGEMPLDAHAFEMASGVVSTATVFAYIALTVLLLFWAASAVAGYRLVGRGARRARVCAGAVRLLAGVFTALAVSLAFRFDAPVALPFGAVRIGFSERTRTILSEAHGAVTATAFVSRDDARYRSVEQLLRAFRRMAAAQGGCRIDVLTVDPRWDFAAARRLTEAGVPAASVLIEKGRRRVVLPLADGFDERAVAAAVQRVTQPPQRTVVYWTRGHGEAAFDDYGEAGASDLARELARDGYRHRPLDLAANAAIPSDCALIVVAGLRVDFSRAETARLDAYLRQGGRLLLTANLAPQGGLAAMLSAWGLRAGAAPEGPARTLSGTDTVVTSFTGHPAVRSLAGAQIVFERPVGFLPSGAAAGADGIAFRPLATAGGACVAAAVERGGALGDDLALRSTRIIAVGDGLFALNGQLRARGNANRVFLQNCVSYLAAGGAASADARPAGALATGMDRLTRLRFAAVCAGALPALAAGALLLRLLLRRGRR